MKISLSAAYITVLIYFPFLAIKGYILSYFEG